MDVGAIDREETAGATITGCTFTGNAATNAERPGDGAVHAYQSDTTIEGSSFVDNTSAADGAGMTLLDGTYVLSSSSLLYNTADGLGGGILLDDASVTGTTPSSRPSASRTSAGR